MTTETCRTVHTQTELDAALADDTIDCVYIESEAAEQLAVQDSGFSRVEAWDSSRVMARDSSRVLARDYSRVEAWDSSTVEARDSSRVEAWDSSTVEARDSSRVEARDSSRVEARDSSRVEACGFSSVEARDSSSVVAWDSSRVEARDSSSVEARGSSSVMAWGYSRVMARGYSRVMARGYTTVHARNSATVNAGPHVTVYLHSRRATVTGGTVIDVTGLDPLEPATWIEQHATVRADGRVLLYKATDPELTTGHEFGRPTTYTVGQELVAEDWRDDNRCGGGLHVSPRPVQAREYRREAHDQIRYVLVSAAVEDVRPIDADKCKVRALRVEAEVDVYGDEVSS